MNIHRMMRFSGISITLAAIMTISGCATVPWYDRAKETASKEKVAKYKYGKPQKTNIHGKNRKAQPVKTESWNRSYGGHGHDEALEIKQTSDGGYIVAGRTNSRGAGNSDAWVLKLSADGAVVWDRVLGGADFDSVHSVSQTGDDGFILAGKTFSKGAGSFDVWVVKLNSAGKLEWDKVFGGKGSDSGYAVLETETGDFVVAGSTESKGAGASDAWVIKLDSRGNHVWDKVFGGKGSESANAIERIKGRGLVVAVNSLSQNKGNTVDIDFSVFKLNDKGKLAWRSDFNGKESDSIYDMQRTSDGGFIVSGNTFSKDTSAIAGNDFLVLKLNSKGKKQWSKTYGGAGADLAKSIRQTYDGGFIIAGDTFSKGSGGSDVWVIKLSSEGELVWDRIFGGEKSDFAESVRQTKDGGFVIAGKTGSKGAGDMDAWVIKLDRDGLLKK